LAEFITYFGEDRPICPGLSKLHEENVRGTTREVLTHFEKTAPRGEIVVVVGGKPIVKEAKEQILRPRRSITQTDMILSLLPN
jgi:16S rRNA (cytidine1402-2'-O)-methyltransferase